VQPLILHLRLDQSLGQLGCTYKSVLH
jgi:hypothetical protein